MAVNPPEIAGEKTRLTLATAAGGHHEHVVADRLSQSVDADGHAFR